MLWSEWNKKSKNNFKSYVGGVPHWSSTFCLCCRWRSCCRCCCCCCGRCCCCHLCSSSGWKRKSTSIVVENNLSLNDSLMSAMNQSKVFSLFVMPVLKSWKWKARKNVVLSAIPQLAFLNKSICSIKLFLNNLLPFGHNLPNFCNLCGNLRSKFGRN